VLHELVQESPKRFLGRQDLEKARSRVAQVSHTLVVDRLDDGLAADEMAVEGAHSHSGTAGDLLDPDVYLPGSEGLARRSDQGVKIALGVGTQWPGRRGPHQRRREVGRGVLVVHRWSSSYGLALPAADTPIPADSTGI